MTTRVLLVTLALVLSAAAAQAAGPVNPSTASWTAPTTNADATSLQDMNLYNLRVAGPAASAPTYNTTVYPVKATKPSSTQAPLANTTVVFGTPATRNLAGDLGLTVDGQYWIVVTAVDLAGNESAPQVAAVPFLRDVTAPASPTNLLLNP